MKPELIYLYLYHFKTKNKISKILQNFWFRGFPSKDRHIYDIVKRISGSDYTNIHKFVKAYIANPKMKLNEIYDDKKEYKKKVRSHLVNHVNKFTLGKDGIQLSKKQMDKIVAMVNRNIDKRWE